LEWLRVRGIRTLINLRRPNKDGVAEEKTFAEENGLHFYHFYIGSSHEAIQDTVKRFLAIVGDKSHWPILVHCSRGKERSGVLAAIFRIEYDRWSNELALEELYRLGLTKDSLPVGQNFIRNYRPRWAGGGGAATKPSQALPEVPWQE
jgi:protein tyrosine/serine phosphatase